MYVLSQKILKKINYFIQEGHSKNIAARILLGFVAGSLASAMNVPFDVCQIRIMGPQPVKGQRKYKSTFQTLNLVYKEEG